MKKAGLTPDRVTQYSSSNRTQRLQARIEILKAEIVQNLEKTGLIKTLEISNTRILYRANESKKSECGALKVGLRRLIERNYPLLNIEYNFIRNMGNSAYEARLYFLSERGQETELRYQFLSDVNKIIESYANVLRKKR